MINLATKLKHGLWLILLLLGLAALAGYFYRESAVGIDQSVTTIPCTEITQGCGNERVVIRFLQEPQAMRPFDMSAQIVNAQDVHVRFAMRGMAMGLNRYRLLKQPDSIWRGQITLPICMQGRSDWLLMLEVTTTTGMQHYQLAFTSH